MRSKNNSKIVFWSKFSIYKLKKERSYTLYLEDILHFINLIMDYIGNYTYDEFRSDSKTIDAVIRNFEIIGEASNKVPSEVKKKYPNIPWSEMYLLRNKVTHEYFGIDYEIIWDIAVNYLPGNKVQVEQVLKKESNPD